MTLPARNAQAIAFGGKFGGRPVLDAGRNGTVCGLAAQGLRLGEKSEFHYKFKLSTFLGKVPKLSQSREGGKTHKA